MLLGKMLQSLLHPNRLTPLAHFPLLQSDDSVLLVGFHEGSR